MKRTRRGQKTRAENNLGGRPQLIDTQKIVSAALELGVDNLSMHAVARKLGVSTTALYRYVASKDVLLDECMNYFCGKIELPDDNLPWQTYMAGVGNAFRKALITTPGASSYGVKIGPTTPAAFRIIEASLTVLQRDNFSPEQSWMAYSMVVDHVFNYVQKIEAFIELEAKNGPGGYKILQLTESDLVDFPHIASALATYTGEVDFEESYQTQIATIIAGIDAEFERRE
ncbi:MAG: TetR/AcrR family transcriptional regulator C-terminal domain-containing protein [Pseudomonadota bacterium]